MSFWSRKGAVPDELPPLPYEPSSPEGLAARWVQWVAASGPVKNPIEDATGEHAAENQPDDVWFLAGTYGKRHERKCFVPAGRDLFLPVLNMWFYPVDGAPEAEELALVREHGSASLSIDGAVQELDEIVTPVPFVVAGARLNGVTNSRKPTPTTVWGLWKRVPALPPGEHTLWAVGAFDGGFTVDVTYRLLVAPAPAVSYPVPF
jgi:hypothetical protein